jgi:glycosyltransferase involved in cell wall biosynthesis
MPDRLDGPSMLALIGDSNGPALWRVLQPITALERRGYPCGWDTAANPAAQQLASAYDGIIIPRMAWPLIERDRARAFFAIARRRRQIVVFEADDDLFSTAMTAHALGAGLGGGKSLATLENERHDTLWAMRQCDGVTVSTEPLAERVRAWTDRPVVVVPNALDLPWFRQIVSAEKRSASGVTIGWAGGQRDEGDLRPLATAWSRIAARYPAVRFVVAGHPSPSLLGSVPADRVTLRAWLPIERYPANLAGLTIGCAALTTAPFNATKSPIKAYEYAAAGAAVVASPTVYGSLIKDGENGLLAETADDWERALSTLVDRPAFRAILARRLLRLVEKPHTLDVNLHRWPEAWATIAESARTRERLVVV